MKYPRYKYFYVFFDMFIIMLSLMEAKKIVLVHNQQYFRSSFTSNILLIYLFIIICFIIIWNFHANNLYKINVLLTKSKHLTQIIRSLLYGLTILVLISFILKFPVIEDSRLFIIVFTITVFLNLLVIRVYLLRLLYLRLKNYSIFSRNILIWGAGKAGKVLAVKLLFENNYGIKIIGFIDDFKVVGSEIISGLKILGDKKSLYDLKNKYAIDEIIVAIDNIDYNNLLDILDVCNKSELNVKLSSELFNIIPQKMFTEVYAGTPVIDISPRVNNDFNHIVKRIIDIVCSSIGLLVLLPLFLILAILIKISSKGPILYKNIRIGKNGKPFIFYKFRSMTVSNNGDMERQKIMIEFMKNSYTQNGEDTKIINSDRLTGIGKFIRKISLDELPQLINVLKGEMSLVGPRPCLPYEYDNYDEWQKRRVSVTPGCTGVWQVSGRSKVSFNDSVVLDLYYIHNMNPWLDLQLIIKTIPVMLFGMGGK